MLDYTKLFNGSINIEELDNDTLFSLINEMADMYDLLLGNYRNRIKEAYSEYREKWIYDHIPQHIYDETLNDYKNSEVFDWWSFTEYVDKYGYTNGLSPACFDEWFDSEWEGEWI